MKFNARYVHRSSTKREEYWRTVFADNLNSATKRAEKYVKDGYILVKVVSVQDAYA